MKFSLAALALASTAPAVLAFSSTRLSSRTAYKSALSSTVEPPERTAPGAGYVPEWENRSGLKPEEFMASDMSKPDLSGMWECPLTRWDSEGYVVSSCLSYHNLELFSRSKQSRMTLTEGRNWKERWYYRIYRISSHLPTADRSCGINRKVFVYGRSYSVKSNLLLVFFFHAIN